MKEVGCFLTLGRTPARTKLIASASQKLAGPELQNKRTVCGECIIGGLNSSGNSTPRRMGVFLTHQVKGENDSTRWVGLVSFQLAEDQQWGKQLK